MNKRLKRLLLIFGCIVLIIVFVIFFNMGYKNDSYLKSIAGEMEFNSLVDSNAAGLKKSGQVYSSEFDKVFVFDEKSDTFGILILEINNCSNVMLPDLCCLSDSKPGYDFLSNYGLVIMENMPILSFQANNSRDSINDYLRIYLDRKDVNSKTITDRYIKLNLNEVNISIFDQHNLKYLINSATGEKGKFQCLIIKKNGKLRVYLLRSKKTTSSELNLESLVKFEGK